MRAFLAKLWPVGRGSWIVEAPTNYVEYPGPGLAGGTIRLGGSADLTAREQFRLPNGIPIAAPLPLWFGREMGGGDIHPEFSPFFRQRRNKFKMLYVPPEHPIMANPLEVDVATHPFAWRSPPIDTPDPIPDGPTF